jgi:hypothetical protein
MALNDDTDPTVITAPPREPGPDDRVEIHAIRNADSIVLHLTRCTAESRRIDLETDGWVVEILDPAPKSAVSG